MADVLNTMSGQQELLVQTKLERLHTRLQHIVSQQPLDLDYLEFVCSQEAVLFSAASNQVLIPKAIVDALTELHKLVVEERENQVLVVSMQIMYLGAANNNRSSTALPFFQQSVDRYGFPSRIERLWRDVWCAVTSIYYSVLHSLEEDGLLDLSNIAHLFSCHYAFLPRLQASLDIFTSGWDNHPLRTEGNLTPNQLWEMGNIQHAMAEPENAEGLYLPHLDWEDSGLPDEPYHGVTVPEMGDVLSDEQMAALRAAINPLGHSQSHGSDIYLITVQYVQHLLGLQ
ncbi:uncharacterized protein LOC127641079 [Xyrauchen texanus]|uniref:uncharacterized protein LOC127641079 n=1 Tax=Xyrauchen texanus TaxID=154827 RepID=UPI002242A0B2|nr:uncharacterized protein LOC127641079 [Xyrauchen texanus]